MAADADVIVVGLGPGGEDVAGRLAEAGLQVIGIEQQLVGGECPYWGCVPSKMMIRAAHALAEAHRVAQLAGAAEVHPDWGPVARRIREEATDNWDDKVAVERLEGKGGRFVRGAARIVGPRTVSVDGKRFEAQRGLVIATGTKPAIPPVPGLADTPVLDQPRRRGDRAGARVADRHRRWRDRAGAGAGVRPVRLAGHGAGGRGAVAAGRGAGSGGAARRRAARRGLCRW